MSFRSLRISRPPSAQRSCIGSLKSTWATRGALRIGGGENFVDVFAGQIHEAPANFKELRKEMNAACWHIGEIWPKVGMTDERTGRRGKHWIQRRITNDPTPRCLAMWEYAEVRHLMSIQRFRAATRNYCRSGMSRFLARKLEAGSRARACSTGVTQATTKGDR